MANTGLMLKGYGSAQAGQMPVKDAAAGLIWVTPVNSAELNTAVYNAQESARSAGQSASTAGNAASDAVVAAGNAERINQQTMSLVNNKF